MDGFLFDHNLSLKARGLLATINAYGGDSVTQRFLRDTSADGQTAVRSAIQELVDNGYLKVERTRDRYGQINGICYTIIDKGE